LYGPSGGPQESDVQQGATPDCFLEAVIGAIVRLDPNTISNILHDNHDSNQSVNVTLYDSGMQSVQLRVDKKNDTARSATQDSSACWVAVLQDAYSLLMMEENSPDDVHDGQGGCPTDVFETVYGATSKIQPKQQGVPHCVLGDFGPNAATVPTVMWTWPSSDVLPGNHAFTVHSANDTYITHYLVW